MSVPRDPVGAAAKVKTPLAAARLHQDLEAELTMGGGSELGPGWEAAAESALDDLEKRFGGADELRDMDVSQRTPGGGTLGVAGHKSSSQTKTKTASTPAGTPAAGAPAGGRGRASSAPSRGRRKSKRSSGGRVSNRFGRQVAGAAGSGDAGTLAMSLLAGTVVLTLIYVLITGKGPNAIAIFGRSLTNGLHLFMAPVDPLGKGSKLQATADAAVQASPGAAGSDPNGGGGDFAPSVGANAPRTTVPSTNAAGKALPNP